MKNKTYTAAMIGVLLLSLWTSGGLSKDNIYFTKKDYPMAGSEKDLDLFHQSMMNNNAAVWLKLQQEHRAWMSKDNREVTIIEEIKPNKVKVRYRNTKTEAWTFREALKP
jgi:hypothetical protein